MKYFIFLLISSLSILSLQSQSVDDQDVSKLYSYLGWDGQLVEQPTIIKGRLTGIDLDSLELGVRRVVYNHLSNVNQQIYFYETSDSGTFDLVFPLMRPQEIMISLPFLFGHVYAVPGKTTSFTLDVGKAKRNAELHPKENWRWPAPMIFDGDLAAFNTHFNAFLPEMRKTFFWQNNQVLIDSLDQMAYKEARRNGRDAQLRSLAAYTTENNMPEEVQIFFETKIKYSFFDDLMRYRWLKNLKKDHTRILLSPEYREFITAENMNNPNGLMTEEYSSWMHELDISLYDFPKTDYKQIYYLLDSADVLEAKDRDYLPNMQQIRKEGDEEKLKAMNKEFRDSILLKYREQLTPYLKQKTYQDKLTLLRNGKVYSSGIGRDIVTTRFFMNQINQNKLLTKKQLNDMDLAIASENLKSYLLHANERLKELDDSEMPDNVTKVSTLYGSGDSLFQVMMKPHRGKVVYVDFWAPWCGPCMTEIRNSGALKKELKRKDIVYYYICVNCEKGSWERTTKKIDIGGEHYLTNNKEYSLLSERYKITGIPRYMLVAPNGKVVNDNAPRPSNAMGVVEAITPLLGKN